MADDKTSAFAADAGGREAELRAELEALESSRGSAGEVTPVEPAEVDEVEVSDELLTVESELLGRRIEITRPTSAAIAIFQSDASSEVLTDVEKMGVMSDFVRRFMSAKDFREWREQCLAKGSAPFFYESLADILELLTENAIEESEEDWKAAENRVKRRAALKAKEKRSKGDAAKG